MRFANNAPIPNTLVGDFGVVEVRRSSNVGKSEGNSESLPLMMPGGRQSLDDVSLIDLWPRPILSRSCFTQGSCDTGRRLHSGPTTIPGCTTTSFEPNQGPLATAPQDLSTTVHYLRQNMQLGHSGLNVENNNYYQDQYASPRVSFDAEASLRDLITSWETATGSHFTPTSTTSYQAEMTPITQSQIVHAGKSYDGVIPWIYVTRLAPLDSRHRL